MAKVVSSLFASYNGFTFPEPVHTTNIRIEPVLSRDRRTVLYNRWVIGLHFEIIAIGGTTDAAFVAALQALSHPGGVFMYQGRGLGNPSVNVGNTRDMMYGPVPKVVNTKILGAGKAIGVDWEIEFHVSNCAGATNPFGVMEFEMRLSHAVNDAGYSSRTYSGSLRVVNNRVTPGSRRVINSADAYRELIVTPVPTGFRRRFQPWNLSSDLSGLEFGWTDSELPVNLPPGIVDATLSDSIGSSGGGLSQWSGTISGTYRMERGFNTLTAASAFFDLVYSILSDRNRRMGILNIPARPRNPFGARPSLPTGGGRLENDAVKAGVTPTGFSMSHPNRYGEPQASFTFSYTMRCSLANLIAATGMYMPLDNDWRLWSASVANGSHHPYGGARLTWLPQDDYGIVDACGTLPGTLTGGTGGFFPPPIPVPPGSQLPPEGPINEQVQELVRGTFPPPAFNDSWVSFDNEIFVEADTGILHVKKLPVSTPQLESGVFGANGLVTPAGDANSLNDLRKFAPPWFIVGGGGQLENTNVSKGIMRRTAESLVIYLRGSAVRSTYPISPPRLVSINGIECVADSRPDRGEGFGIGIRANAVNSLYFAYWNLRYVLPSVPPGPLPVPPNPFDRP